MASFGNDSQMRFIGDPSCEVKLLDFSEAGDESWPFNKMLICFRAKFTAHDGGDNSRGDSVVLVRTFMAQLVALEEGHDQRAAGKHGKSEAEVMTADEVAGMLSAVRVPALGSIVDKVVDGADRLLRRHAGDWAPRSCILRMNVDIDLVVDRLPEDPEDHDDDYDVNDDDLYDYDDDDQEGLDFYDDDDEVKFVPASEESIEGLEKLRIGDEDSEKPLMCCVVCLEDIPVGSEATKLPCSHHFHGHCIVEWLRTSKFCPLCRFEMPS